MSAPFTESVVEQAALGCLESIAWSVKNGAEIAPGEPAAEQRRRPGGACGRAAARLKAKSETEYVRPCPAVFQRL